MADERDFRVRTHLYIEDEGVARGLYNHVLGLKDDALDINPGKPNAEMRYVELDDHYLVDFDLCFPREKQGMAIGLFNHTKNTPSQKSPIEDIDCFVSLERCGHRIEVSCELIEKHIVE